MQAEYDHFADELSQLGYFGRDAEFYCELEQVVKTIHGATTQWIANAETAITWSHTLIVDCRHQHALDWKQDLSLTAADKLFCVALISNPEQREGVYQQGFHEHLTWPIGSQELTQRLGTYCALSNAISQGPYRRTNYRESTVTNACCYMMENLHRAISLNHLANQAGLNRSDLNILFKQRFGCGPITWLRKTRLEQAAKLLSTSSRSIVQIALEVGYQDANNFSTAFRKYHGITPKKFQKNCLNQSNSCQLQRHAAPPQISMY